MRLRLFLLLGSLTANLWLFASWQGGRKPAAATPQPPRPVVPSAPPAAPSPIDPQTWRELTTGDAREFVARLKAQGYPPALLRAIVQAQLREQYAARFRAVFESAGAQPYWIRGFNAFSEAGFNISLRALGRELREQQRQLLGDDWMVTEAAPRELVRRYGHLPTEKILEVARINDDYNDLRSQVAAEARGITLPEDREKLAFIEKERRADLARLLTPEELENYDLRTSTTSNRLRSQLTAFEPSEAEYRVLYRVHQQLDHNFGRTETLTPELRRQRSEAEQQLGPQIAAALGPARYADYQRTTEPSWLEAHRAVKQLELPPTTLAPLATIQQDATKRAEALRNDRALTTAQRNAQLQALEQEAITRLTALLRDRFEDYRAQRGFWLRSLRPPPTRSTPSP